MHKEIRALFDQARVDLQEADWDFFERLRLLLEEANRRMNLTRLTEPRDFYLKHVLDSWMPFLVLPELRNGPESLLAADLGSGAGFPGLVVARLRPGWGVALIERTQKKAAFLEATAEALGLENVFVVPLDARDAPGRAEVLRRGCGLVLARAVGPLAAVNRSAAALLAPRGLLLHYKGGALGAEEVEEGRAAARKLGLRQREPRSYTLPGGMKRTAVLVSRPSGRRPAGARRRS